MILILGRFQPLHKGHLKVISDAYGKDRDMVIAIGSSQESKTKDNPFSAQERRKMIDSTLKKHGIVTRIVTVPDIPDDDAYVDHVIRCIGARPDKVITENPTTDLLFSKKGIGVDKTERHFDLSATNIRNRISKDQPWKDLVPEDVAVFIEGIGGVEKIKKIFSASPGTL
ncbi:nicotinamide-nucleotide adenylyltransferase [Candidatus Woesearchaeota archaeon]|nr:nicotinamide-nucleotide adenylyltransferase [Candidatus Woesearchaeota archaeon]